MSDIMVLDGFRSDFYDCWEAAKEILTKVLRFTFSKIEKIWNWGCSNPDQALTLAIAIIIASQTGDFVSVLTAIKAVV